MSGPHVQAIRMAERMLAVGNAAGAIEPLRDALTAQPDEAYPHLLLSRALRLQGRLAGARHEAERAVAIEPLWALPHLELAHILMLQQRRPAALAAADHAIELDPGEAYAHLVRARLLRLMGRRQEARTSLAAAQALEPNAQAIIAEEGYAALEAGDADAVEASGRALLSRHPGDTDGLILTGHAQLARGDVEEALRLALTALASESVNVDALHLLAAAKMRKNVIGGLWWRWNRFLIKLGEARAIFFIVGIWVVYRWASLGSRDLGLPEIVGTVLSFAYLAFVIYTVSAGTVVSRMVAKEVEQVRLRPSF